MEITMFVFIALVALFVFALWIWSVVDIIRSDFKKESDKIIWLVVVLSLHLLGSILYWMYGVKQKVETSEELV